jgi:hypothetical protein
MFGSDEQSEIIKQLKKEFELGFDYKAGRLEDWHQTEDLYYGKVKKSLKGRFNIPLPIMSGFINTLISKIDDPPIIQFTQGNEADYRGTQKVQAFADKIRQKDDYDWDMIDIDGKKINSMYGRTIFKAYGEYDKNFNFCLSNTDVYDFYCDPLGGGDLENHSFCGENNIVKSKADLEEGAKSGLYDTKSVKSLLNNLDEAPEKKDDRNNEAEANRYYALDLDNKKFNYVAGGACRLVESGTTYKGQRLYCLWSYERGVLVRCELLKDVFKSNLWQWTSWASNRDIFNFWSLAPADDMRPIAEVMKILANQEFDNRHKQNWGMRAYDPAMFPNGAELQWRPNGLVAVRYGSSQVQAIGNGLYEFKTPQLGGTIDLVNWLNGFVGEKTGITAGAQGQSQDDKVGIYYGNLQQVADRLGLFNKSYVKAWKSVSRRFLWACKEHLNSPEAIKLIGADGVEWDKISKDDVNPGIDIMITGSNAQVQLDEIKKKRQLETLMSIEKNPEQSKNITVKWLIEQKLTNAGYTIEEIRQATDVENFGNRDLMGKAAEAIEEIVEGKNAKPVRNANTAFLQKILDFAMDNTDEDQDLFNRLMAYIDLHYPIVIENMGRKLFQQTSTEALLRGQQGQNGQIPPAGMPNALTGQIMGEEPMPNTMGGTMERSMEMAPAI